MENIAYIKAFQKQQKISYKGLNDAPKKYIKAKEKFEQMDKALNSFYSSVKRNPNGSVDFANLSNDELDAFNFWNKEKEKALKCMDRLENYRCKRYSKPIFTTQYT